MNKADKTHSVRERVASRARGRQRRNDIVDTAIVVLLESGYDGLVLREVASRVGISIGNLHYYFPSKQELFLAIFDQKSNAYAENVHEAVASASSRKERLRAIADLGLAVIKNPEVVLWRFLVALAQHDAEALALLRHENGIYHDATAKELQRIIPHLTKYRALHISRLFWAMLDGLSLSLQIDYVQENTAEAQELEREVHAVILALVDAV